MSLLTPLPSPRLRSTSFSLVSTSPSSSSCTCEVSPINLINGEIVAVTSAMRKNARWAAASTNNSSASNNGYKGRGGGGGGGGGPAKSRGTALASSMGLRNSTVGGEGLNGVSERNGGASLMAGFTALRMELRDIEDVSSMDALTLLHPFLEVIRSGETSGPITSTALSSVDKFITYQLIHSNSPSLSLAMANISSAATHCKFEASDSTSDEVVLLKILDVLKNALICGLGETLSDEAVCEMMETGLSMCCQMRLSEILRRSAERTMQGMVSAVFRKLQHLPSDADDLQLATPSSPLLSDSLPSSTPAKDGEVSQATSSDPSGAGVSIVAPDPTSGVIGPAPTNPIVSAVVTVTDSVIEPAPAGVASHLEGVNGAGIDGGEGVTLAVPRMGSEVPGLETEKGGAGVEPPLSPGLSLSEKMEADPPTVFKPYGLPSIRELLRVLVSLLNPHDQQHTDTMRLMALGILNTAFEVGGRSIGRFPSLRQLVADDLCKYLLQLARSDNIHILSTSLRVISTVFDTMRSHLKLQQELFLSYLMDLLSSRYFTISGSQAVALKRIGQAGDNEFDPSQFWEDGASSTSSPRRPSSPASGGGGGGGPGIGGGGFGGKDEARELMLEILAHPARHRDFMTVLWVNYDCHIDCEDLFERMIKFSTRGVFPAQPGPSHAQDNAQLLSMDVLLSFINHLANRVNDSSLTATSPDHPSPGFLSAEKERKRILLEGGARFNEKPKKGLAYLEEHGMIYTDPSVPRPAALGRFLRTCPKLSKAVLGDYITKPENIDVLEGFIRSCDFKDKPIADAMRELLESFRLPGEAQPISRVTETFAKVYFSLQPEGIKSADALYVLTYSVIMLNTDQHNPQNRKRMQFEDYKRNLRGTNDGEDYPIDMLKGIYDAIRKREIVMPEEHHGRIGFEYAWKELLRRTQQAGPLIAWHTAAFDRDMFSVSWKMVVSAMAYAFANFQDDYMLQRVIAGFRQCATLASHYDFPEVFDFIILSLSKIAGLSQSSASPETTFPVTEVEGQKITVSPLSIQFGSNVKAQLAAVVLFTIINGSAQCVSAGWTPVFEILQVLFAHSVLPPTLLAMDSFLNLSAPIPLRPKAQAAAREEKRQDGGLLSTLSSYLLSPYSAAAEAIGRDITDEDIESTLCTIDCIASCRIDELYSDILNLSSSSIVAPIMSLVGLLRKSTTDQVRAKVPSSASPTSSPTTVRGQMAYDPSSVFLLEVVVSIVRNAQASVKQAWSTVFSYLSEVLSMAPSYSVLFVERAVVGLLRAADRAAREPELRSDYFLALDALRSLPPSVASTVSEQLMSELSQTLLQNPNLVQSPTQWKIVFSLWTMTVQREEASRLSFDLAERLAAGQLGDGLRADIFVPYVETLAAYGQAAGSREIKPSNLSPSDPSTKRALRALDLIREVQGRIPAFITSSEFSFTKAWEIYWIPVLSAYAQQSVNSSRELRRSALASLQRTLISPEILTNADIDLTTLFERILFPTLDELLKPQVFRRDPEGMGETRLHASALLSKIFLHYLIQLAERQGMVRLTELWEKVLGYYERMMLSGRRDQMFEAIPENVKNVLLVMNASGFLLPPLIADRTPEQVRLWDATFTRVNAFLPDLQKELFPQSKHTAPPPVPPTPLLDGFGLDPGSPTKPQSRAEDAPAKVEEDGGASVDIPMIP